MPLDTKKYNVKEIKAIEAYTNPESESFGVKIRSYISAGYSNKRSADGNAIRFYNKDRIVQGINEYKAEIEQKVAVTRDYITKHLQDQYTKADQVKDRTNALRALDLLGKSIGIYIDSTQDVTDQQAELDKKQQEEARAIATLRLAQ